MKKQTKTAKIRAMLEEGKSVKEIAAKLKVKPASVYYVRHRLNKPARLEKYRQANELRKAKDAEFFAQQDALRKAAEPVDIYTLAEPVDAADHPVHYDPVNHPAHYKSGGIETIDFIEAKRLGYHLGNVVKYISRAYHKGGMEDLLKAQWYLNRAIEKGEV